MPPVLTGESSALHDFVNEPTRNIVAHLAKNDFDLQLEDIVLADFVECDFPGYEPIRVTAWIDKESDDETLGEVVSEFFFFQADGLVVPQQCTAIYITVQEGAGVPELLQCEIFDQALIFAGDGQFFKRRVRINSFDIPEE